MAMYVDDSGGDSEGNMATSDDIQTLMVQKAHELFSVCDIENKGFICKRDMQRLTSELPLTPEQLEGVFDSLDDDQNGYLTLEEFTGGFSSFLGLGASGIEKQESISSGAGSELVYENEHAATYTDTADFDEVLDNIGAAEVFDDVSVLQTMWARLRQDEPELLGDFETFMSRVTGEMKRSHGDLRTLEAALRNKSASHEEEVRKLYDEMESQIRVEKERVLAEEKSRERQRREELERELREKDRLLQETLNRHVEMEDKLVSLNSQDTDFKTENERLLRDKQDLEILLVQSQRNLEESRSHIHDIRSKTQQDKRDRALAAMQVSEGIAMERESLVKQLDMLRDMNKKLRDERDENDSWRLGERAPNIHPSDSEPDMDDDEDEEQPEEHSTTEPEMGKENGELEPDDSPLSRSTPARSSKRKSTRRKQLAKQGSVMSNYFDGPPRPSGLQQQSTEEESYDVGGIEVDDSITPQWMASESYGDRPNIYEPDPEALAAFSAASRYGAGPENGREMDAISGCSGGVDREPWLAASPDLRDSIDTDASTTARAPSRASTTRNSNTQRNYPDSSIPNSPRSGPDGVDGSELVEAPIAQPTVPERMFKVVFVGDSGVGKSSFIHQFCNNEFKSSFSATIGVDFQVKPITVEGHLVALQVWDTAGQERFRSITKQYFRKADGVLIMYDVTSETSFTNVRNWMDSVEEGTDEGTVLTLVGNKIDLAEDDDHRAVKFKDGSRLAEEYSALFFESSAKNGSNVFQTMHDMASLLREKEDKQIENAVVLADEANKKKGCCS